MKLVQSLLIYLQLLSVLYWALAFGYYFMSPAILEVLLKLGEGLPS